MTHLMIILRRKSDVYHGLRFRHSHLHIILCRISCYSLDIISDSSLNFSFFWEPKFPAALLTAFALVLPLAFLFIIVCCPLVHQCHLRLLAMPEFLPQFTLVEVSLN